MTHREPMALSGTRYAVYCMPRAGIWAMAYQILFPSGPQVETKAFIKYKLSIKITILSPDILFYFSSSNRNRVAFLTMYCPNLYSIRPPNYCKKRFLSERPTADSTRFQGVQLFDINFTHLSQGGPFYIGGGSLQRVANLGVIFL